MTFNRVLLKKKQKKNTNLINIHTIQKFKHIQLHTHHNGGHNRNISTKQVYINAYCYSCYIYKCQFEVLCCAIVTGNCQCCFLVFESCKFMLKQYCIPLLLTTTNNAGSGPQAAYTITKLIYFMKLIETPEYLFWTSLRNSVSIEI